MRWQAEMMNFSKSCEQNWECTALICSFWRNFKYRAESTEKELQISRNFVPSSPKFNFDCFCWIMSKTCEQKQTEASCYRWTWQYFSIGESISQSELQILRKSCSSRGKRVLQWVFRRNLWTDRSFPSLQKLWCLAFLQHDGWITYWAKTAR